MASHFVLTSQTKKWTIEREGVFVWKKETDSKKASK